MGRRSSKESEQPLLGTLAAEQTKPQEAGAEQRKRGRLGYCVRELQVIYLEKSRPRSDLYLVEQDSREAIEIACIGKVRKKTEICRGVEAFYGGAVQQGCECRCSQVSLHGERRSGLIVREHNRIGVIRMIAQIEVGKKISREEHGLDVVKEGGRECYPQAGELVGYRGTTCEGELAEGDGFGWGGNPGVVDDRGSACRHP